MTPTRITAAKVVRSIDSDGHTMRALTITSKLRLLGSALAAALAMPDIQSTLTTFSWRTGAGRVTGASVVCRGLEPRLLPERDTATGAVAQAKVVRQGSDGPQEHHQSPRSRSPSCTRRPDSEWQAAPPTTKRPALADPTP